MISFRQVARHGDRVRLGLSFTTRQFSASHTIAAEGDGQPPRRPASKISSTATIPRKPRPSNPPGSAHQGRPRPAKALDARAFAAPRAGGEQPKILRSPRLRSAGGNAGGNRGGKPSYGKGKSASQKNSRKPRRKGPRRADVDDSEDLTAAAIEQLERDQILKSRPVPVRYEPRDIDISTLQETWPSIPTDINARSTAVLEKLTNLSGRFANGYVPPYELGRRIWKGQSVLFHSEEERSEAMEEVNRLAQARADKMSQKKGDLVEPRKVEFRSIDTQDSKALLETYAQGKYPSVEVAEGQSAVLGEVVKNLRNNGTYQTAGKRPQFLAKVESLLASSRVKRT
ncbi:hypothetical protein N7478_002582 [Penicillium angulare]|uniref:uncharacterized protein n=1 Tax=Penicillium angulare TaxID=116970 RepID=UPI002541E6B0|nr:uncharacterized protein N7478_002582 [Penicillium angulare]KAJ5286896.1 hypothetical protein N7478_002582 [Penicillium angulare]